MTELTLSTSEDGFASIYRTPGVVWRHPVYGWVETGAVRQSGNDYFVQIKKSAKAFVLGSVLLRLWIVTGLRIVKWWRHKLIVKTIDKEQKE